MLKDSQGAMVLIKDATSLSPFVAGLEYGAPARGTWNIVHVGMLIPESHQIFVCAQGCLRGVVLTAAEMDALDRFSTIAVLEDNVLGGDMEDLIIDGVTDILGKIKNKPRAVLVYTSCVHHFIACDLDLVYRTLRKKLPDIDFTDCYMIPIMRKSGLTPDQIMRRQLYSLWRPLPLKKTCLNIIGNNIPTDVSSELVRMIEDNGLELRDITLCENYDQYLAMAESFINISYLPVAKAGGEELQKRLGQQHLYLPLCYGYEEIEKNLYLLAQTLAVPMPDTEVLKQAAERKLAEAKAVIGDMPIAIDYTATPRPLGLAKLLLQHGFNVQSIYADDFTQEEENDFIWLKEQSPELKIFATVNAKMRFMASQAEGEFLAIGQKAAYFTGTNYFVNIVEGGGMYGFDGICRLCDLLIEAKKEAKNARELIQIKGLGCCCV